MNCESYLDKPYLCSFRKAHEFCTMTDPNYKVNVFVVSFPCTTEFVHENCVTACI